MGDSSRHLTQAAKDLDACLPTISASACFSTPLGVCQSKHPLHEMQLRVLGFRPAHAGLANRLRLLAITPQGEDGVTQSSRVSWRDDDAFNSVLEVLGGGKVVCTDDRTAVPHGIEKGGFPGPAKPPGGERDYYEQCRCHQTRKMGFVGLDQNNVIGDGTSVD